jgi:hypothetical protein
VKYHSFESKALRRAEGHHMGLAHPARRERRRIRPLTWIVAVALTPVLIYDVWQTVQDVKHRHEVRGYVIAGITGSHHG